MSNSLREEWLEVCDERDKLKAELHNTKIDHAAAEKHNDELIRKYASAEAANTHLSLEVERLKASRLRWRSVAYDKNAALVAALAANTPLREERDAIERLLREAISLMLSAKEWCDARRAQPELGRLVLENALGIESRLRTLLAGRPAVTGTTSDKNPICKPGDTFP